MTYAETELFGNGRLTGRNQEELEMFYTDLLRRNWDQMSDYLGESEACPRVKRIKADRGAEQSAKDYAELLFLRREMYYYIQLANPRWYQDLTTSRARNPGEPVGDVDRDWIPTDHDQVVKGPALLNSYNLPRLMREFLGPRENRSSERFNRAYRIFISALDNSREKSHSTTEMIVNIAEHFAQVDQDPLKYVRRLLSKGKLEEDNQYQEYQDTVFAMADLQTSLWNAYSKARQRELQQKGIAILNDIFPHSGEIEY